MKAFVYLRVLDAVTNLAASNVCQNPRLWVRRERELVQLISLETAVRRNLFGHHQSKGGYIVPAVSYGTSYTTNQHTTKERDWIESILDALVPE